MYKWEFTKYIHRWFDFKTTKQRLIRISIQSFEIAKV